MWSIGWWMIICTPIYKYGEDGAIIASGILVGNEMFSIQVEPET